MEDVDVKDIVYQYLKTCDGQLDLSQCAADLQLAIEDVLKAVALLEGEGRIKVEATKAPLTEAPPVVAETKESEDITPTTPSEEMWTKPMNPPLEEAVQPPIEFTTDVAPAEAPQEQTLPPAEPIAPTEKPEVVVVEAPTETPEPQPAKALKEEEVTVEKPAEVAIETRSAEALAETPTIPPSEPSISPVETTTSFKAAPEPTAPAIKPPEEHPTTPKKSIEPLVITEGQIILEKVSVPKTNPAQETQQIQEVENSPTIQPTTVATIEVKEELPVELTPATQPEVVVEAPTETPEPQPIEAPKEVAPKLPLPKITSYAVCTNCGLPTNTLLKQWSIKGRIAKKSVLISLYKCPTCGTTFRSAETIEAEA